MKKLLVLAICALLGTSSIFANHKPGKAYKAKAEAAVAYNKKSHVSKNLGKYTVATLVAGAYLASRFAPTWTPELVKSIFGYSKAQLQANAYNNMSAFWGKPLHLFNAGNVTVTQ